ncbi:unnamed protein product [Blepharisma stoltei]|uniref:Carbonic anhydrase n=1 Tax=Blepharisma stoltei TaxID=1481888 RepID=A0AAU9I890_9CILI|nr:unnamed protein product [Blepharisma stoltei]
MDQGQYIPYPSYNYNDTDQHRLAVEAKIKPNSFMNPNQLEAVVKPLRALDFHQTQTGRWPEEDEWEYGAHHEAEWCRICHIGYFQSPINIDPDITFKSAEFLHRPHFPIRLHYHPTSLKGNFNAKTFIVQGNLGNLAVNSFIHQDQSRIFDEAQFHFHAPSEHLLNGRRYDLEMHVVHKERSNTNNIAVLGFVFKEDGVRNPFIDQVIRSSLEPTYIDMNLLIPQKSGVFYYEGSLTTPPAFETVLWFVVGHVLSVNREQLEFFARQWGMNPAFAGGKGNYRELQPPNGRAVIYFE